MVWLVLKVMLVPGHTSFCEAEIFTTGFTSGFTVMVAVRLVAVGGNGQSELLVITTHTESLLFNVLLEYELARPFCFDIPSTKKL